MKNTSEIIYCTADLSSIAHNFIWHSKYCQINVSFVCPVYVKYVGIDWQSVLIMPTSMLR